MHRAAPGALASSDGEQQGEPGEQGDQGYQGLPGAFPAYQELYPLRRAPSPSGPPPELIVGHWQNNTQPIYFDRQSFVCHLMDPSHRLSMIDSITLDDAVALINKWYARQGFFLTNKGWIPSLTHRSTSHKSVRRCSGLRQCPQCSRYYSNKRSKRYCTAHRYVNLTPIPCRFSITFQWNCQPGHEEGVLSAMVAPHSFENGMVCMHSHPCITRKAAQRDDEARARQASVAEELADSSGPYPRPFSVPIHALQPVAPEPPLLTPPLQEMPMFPGLPLQELHEISDLRELGELPELQELQELHELTEYPSSGTTSLRLSIAQPIPIPQLQLSLPLAQPLGEVPGAYSLPTAALQLPDRALPLGEPGALSPLEETRSLPASIGDDGPLAGEGVAARARGLPGAPLGALGLPGGPRMGGMQPIPSVPVLPSMVSPFCDPAPGADGAP